MTFLIMTLTLMTFITKVMFRNYEISLFVSFFGADCTIQIPNVLLLVGIIYRKALCFEILCVRIIQTLLSTDNAVCSNLFLLFMCNIYKETVTMSQKCFKYVILELLTMQWMNHPSYLHQNITKQKQYVVCIILITPIIRELFVCNYF